MVYTILVLLKNVIPSELPNNAAIQAVPKTIEKISMGEIECINTSQFYPAGYIRPFDPSHIPPYEIIEYIPIRAHDFGYIYIQTKAKIPSPILLISALNYLSEFEGIAIFLDAEEGAIPLELMHHFINTAKKTKNLDQSTKNIAEFYEMALKARYEVDSLIKAYRAAHHQLHRQH